MFGTHFYNEGLRRLTIAFGQIFNDIIVQTKDANDSVVKRFKVPLAYAPKEKFIVRLTQQPDLMDKQFSTILPRMGFEISNIEYDPSRKLNKMSKTRMPKVDGNTSDQTNKMIFNYNKNNKLFNKNKLINILLILSNCKKFYWYDSICFLIHLYL